MKNFIWKLKQRWMLFCDPDIKWRCTNCGWLPSHYNEYMSHYNEYMGENPHYCPQCGAKVINYKGELPFAEPDVTDKDFRKSIEEKFRVTNQADFNPCPKCGTHNKGCIGFNTSLLHDYIETFSTHRIVKFHCCECGYKTYSHKDFEGCLNEWNNGVCRDIC